MLLHFGGSPHRQVGEPGGATGVPLSTTVPDKRTKEVDGDGRPDQGHHLFSQGDARPYGPTT